MKLAPILPASSCYLIRNRSYHMAVAPMLDAIPRYRDFYKELTQKLRSKFVILDNGAWESATVTAETLVHWGREIQAAAIIIPDVFKHGKETKYLYEKNIGYLRETWKGKLLAVPQGRTFREWRSCVKYLAQRDFDMWALPKVTEVLFREDGMRDQAAREILSFDPQERPIHYLGIWSNPIEMYHTNQDNTLIPHIMGVDSKIFYRLAKSGVMLDPERGLLDNHKPPRHMQFSDERLLSPQHMILCWNMYCGYRWAEGRIPEWEKFLDLIADDRNVDMGEDNLSLQLLKLSPQTV